MKNCTHCIHAEWKKTTAGKLHPSGDGRCTKVVGIPKLPPCMWWSYGRDLTKPFGGHINRHKELKEDCVYWERKP